MCRLLIIFYISFSCSKIFFLWLALINFESHLPHASIWNIEISHMQESLRAKASYTKMETVWIGVSALGKYKAKGARTGKEGTSRETHQTFRKSESN